MKRRRVVRASALLLLAVSIIALVLALWRHYGPLSITSEAITRCGEPREAREYKDAIAQARPLVTNLMKSFGAPGMAVAVSVDGELVWSECYGYADVKRKIPVCPWTRFRIGSISKSLTATAVGLLYDQGRLDLDAPIQRYAPDFPDKGYTITTRQLAGHLAGIRHYTASEHLSQKHYSSVGESLNIFKDDPLLFPPGTRFSYSSYGYDLIGAVIEG